MKNLITAILYVLVLLVVFNCVNTKADASEIKLITATEMKTILELEDVQLIDVRTPLEFNSSHIDSAQNIDYRSPSFKTDIEQLDKSKPVVLYCKSGGRSAKCAKILKEAGFKKIYDLKGGVSKWHFETTQNKNKKS